MNETLFFAACSYAMMVSLATRASLADARYNFFFTFLFPLLGATPVVLLSPVLNSFAHPAFAMAKLYSVLGSAACVWYILRCPHTVWGRRLRVLAFALNVLEAVLTELQQGFILNPLAGLLLLPALPLAASIKVEEKRQIMRWDSSLLWVSAYSVWNIAFSTNLYPSLIYFNVLHVVIAYAFVVKDPGWYAQIRAISLNISFSLMIAFWPALNILRWPDPQRGPFHSVAGQRLAVQGLSLLAALLSLAALIEQAVKKTGRFYNFRVKWLRTAVRSA